MYICTVGPIKAQPISRRKCQILQRILVSVSLLRLQLLNFELLSTRNDVQQRTCSWHCWSLPAVAAYRRCQNLADPTNDITAPRHLPSPTHRLLRGTRASKTTPTYSENVQIKATKMIPVFKNYDYSQRLKACSLPTLHYRRIRGDMIETYKIVTGIYDVEVTPKLYPAHSLVTRGNDLRLLKGSAKYDLRKF